MIEERVEAGVPGRLQAAWEAAKSTSELDVQLARETLKGEHLRATVLAGLLATGFVLIGLYALLFDLRGTPLLGEAAPTGFLLAISAALLALELGIRHVVKQRLKRAASLPAGLRYLNGVVEISAVSVALAYVGFRAHAPVHALVLPAVSMYFLLVLLSTLRLEARLSLFTGLVAAIEYLVLALVAINRVPDPSGVAPMFLSARFYAGHAAILFSSGMLAALVAWQIRQRVQRAFVLARERDQILKVFGQMASPAIVEQLLRAHAGDTTGRRRQVAVMFVDIRGFTAFSETQPPETVVAYLNLLFEPLIEIVSRHQGIIHQLLGDGFMALFGAPLSHGNDSLHAARAALEIVRHVEHESRGGRLPPTPIGIGLHAGEALTGMIGSAIHKEYKVTGDVVNVAARLEKLNKQFGSRLLVSGAVWEAVAPDLPAEGVDLGWVPLEGRARPVRVYRLA